MKKYKILITNDDGINSPGLKAAAEAILDFGNVMVVAPTNQQTGTGRGLTGDKESKLQSVSFKVNGFNLKACLKTNRYSISPQIHRARLENCSSFSKIFF